jgi:hypothetical protein
MDELPFLAPEDRRLLSQIQGRSYANIFGLVERFITAKMLELSRDHCWAIRRRSRPWSVSRTRSSSTRRCSGGWRR